MAIEQVLGNDLGNYVAAAAGLGTAAFALVDASKAFFGGGASRNGYSYIEQAMTRLLGKDNGDKRWPSLDSVNGTLRANWINGTSLADQKAIAKSLIKLRLNTADVKTLAEATGVNAETLAKVAGKFSDPEPKLEQQETEVYGRFDFILTAMLDEAYNKADQTYRNRTRVWAMAVAMTLAFVGGWSLNGGNLTEYLVRENVAFIGQTLLIGLLATPLAPIAKDLTSALSAGVRAAQLFRK